ncbi:uroporphyrinogen-III C-methyltransferase [Trichlorobacter lovleyi]|uniref:Uroporphyrin-III C-methyltransferase n=1 Tax=Trichlorobacter lovleyi (strain ATCC BAA-1151 / DSM 17278 / SZ) TaxID=398767 RepID=B3EBS4_TRIL1|nr:uroporphyrinogen-III C-methyltransferase [Trichlorobacter lovleyi]ACD97356.1 uroporphyrin-III C-methyltransferase [Trichlorobacter lovleyi SZ]
MFLPLQIQMENRPCLIVGGSTVAARKCSKLIEYGARVSVVAPVFCDDPVWQSPQVSTVTAPYTASQLDGMQLVIAATDDPAVNQAVLDGAASRGILAQRTDHPDAGDFLLPATLRRGSLTVSFATEGVNPAFSRLLRDHAQNHYDDTYTRYCELMAAVRDGSAWQQLSKPQRKQGLRAMARCSVKVLSLLRSGQEDAAIALLETAAGIRVTATVGGWPLVYLIGAGPGDPGLITVKGAQRLQEAEVVLYDGYANPLLLEQYCPFAEHIDVGKHKGGACPTQAEINALLLAKAQTGVVVARLKGGDPLMFGRGGEEARLLAEHGIPFEIIPGVSSGLAAPAYAGIPVTDREFASSVGFYSMHKKEGTLLSEQEWQRMAQGPDTLVLLMGSTVLAEIAENLIRYGRAPSTPVALITKGTHPTQTRYLATLATITALAARHRPQRPGLVVVGDVAGVAPAMDWFPCTTIRDET